MNTKRFILLTTILTVLILAPFTLGGLLLPAQYTDTFMGELPVKLERLENAAGRRLIVIGGSGMAFAVDSELLEEEFPGFTAVNLGMYADLGTKFLLDLTEDKLRQGDIVILAQATSVPAAPSRGWMGTGTCCGMLRGRTGGGWLGLCLHFPWKNGGS